MKKTSIILLITAIFAVPASADSVTPTPYPVPKKTVAKAAAVKTASKPVPKATMTKEQYDKYIQLLKQKKAARAKQSDAYKKRLETAKQAAQKKADYAAGQMEEQKRRYDKQAEDARKQREEQQRQHDKQAEDAKKQQEETAKKEDEKNRAEARLKAEALEAQKRDYEEYKKGLKLETQRNYRQAFEVYSGLLNSRAYYTYAYIRIAACYIATGNRQKAVEYYKKYLAVKPGDTAIAAYAQKLEDSSELAAEKALASKSIQEEYKSPYSAVLFSHLDLFPLNAVYAGYGNYYSRSRLQDWFPASSSMSLLGDMMIGAAAGLQANNGTFHAEKAYTMLYGGGALLLSSGLLFDLVSSPFIATDNAEQFLKRLKTTELKVESEKVGYKDPLFTSLFSVTAGIIPGAGHWWAGDNDTALKLLIATPLLTSVVYEIGNIYAGSPKTNEREIGKAIRYSSAGVYLVMRCIDLYGSLLHTDRVNGEYYKQLLCPNSPFKITEKKDVKSPALAFGIAAVPGILLHGAGNFYAENYWAAYTLAGVEGAGILMYVSAGSPKDVNSAQNYIKYTGLALFGLSYLYDVMTAPGYTAIYNAVYTDSQDREIKQSKTGMYPIISPESSGIMLALGF